MSDNSEKLQLLDYLTDEQKERLADDLDLDPQPDTEAALLVLDTVLYRLFNLHLSDLPATTRLQVLFSFRDCRVYCTDVSVPVGH